MKQNRSDFKTQFKSGWDVFLNSMGKIAEQKHMAALRDGFALLVPLIIAASFGVICMTFIFGWWDTASTSILGWITWGIEGQMIKNDSDVWVFAPNSVALQISTIGTFIFYTIWKGIFSFLSIFITLTIAYSFARIKQVKDPFITSLVGLGAFMILSYGDTGLFGTTGMLVAIISALLSVELFAMFEKNKKLELKMPAGVPQAVSRSFSKLFPTVFTLLIMIGLQAPFMIALGVGTANGVGDAFGFGHAISFAIQAPFIELANDTSATLAIGLVYTFFVAFLWFFGIHGSNVLLAIFGPLTLTYLERNQQIVAGEITGTPSAMADGTLDAFVFFGGVGATLAFVLVGLFISKRKETREILKFGGPSAIFNINEPLIFGVPLILNVSYAIPFIIIQPVLYVITWLAIEQFGIVPPVIVKIPFTSPVGIGGFLAVASWEGIILSLMNFTIACLIYTPFVIFANNKAKRNNEELVKIEYKAAFNKLTHRKSALNESEKGVKDGK
ncbi:MAG: PTS sugar transporter subunit IIC [Mycoplasmoidaceae bacterium]